MSLRTLGYFVAVAALTGAGCQRTSTSTEIAATEVDSAQTPRAQSAPSASAAQQVPAATPYPSATVEQIERYAAQAQALSAQLAPGADTAAATRSAETLLALGAGIVPAFVERHPHCGEYLAAALQVQDGWRRMDAARLERDFHHDGALPKVEGEQKTCYHMKDLVVHPATALVLLSQSPPDIASAQKEITEVLAHAHVVKQG